MIISYILSLDYLLVTSNRVAKRKWEASARFGKTIMNTLSWIS